jgi:two-component system phosphate regulon sensor histidine kinase PhoR
VGLAGTLTLAVLLVLLALAASLSTMYVISRPLRRLEAVVRKLAGGDHAARAAVSGPAEVRALGRSVNELARQRDRLRAEEAESNRLRAQAREAGLRIREHLVADEVLREAYLALEANLDAEVVSLRLVHDGELGPRLGDHRERELPTDLAVSRIPNFAWDRLYDLFRRQRCAIFNDLRGKKAEQARAAFAPPVYEAFLRSGVVGILMTPFGVGSDMLGLIVAQRLHADHRWSPAEVDMVESIAADLGRGLNHARLYEAENRLVEELKELNRAKSDFFATTSHELRSPLTTIEGYAEMLGDGEAGEITPQQRKMLDVIDRSSVQLRNLIEDLFTLSKLESGAANTVMQPVDLGGVVANAVDSVQPSVTPAQLTLTCRVPEDKLVVSGDTSQLERVVVNLLTNAVKYTPPGGLVHVTAHAAEKSAVVSIRDTGIGIPEGDQQKLFSRFFRASNATTSRIPGTGLGLAIIHTIVSQHGGDVTLTSREGAGTVATVTLPLLVPAASTDPVTSQGPRVPER